MWSAGTCPSCSAALQTPIACGECGALIDCSQHSELSPFAILGMEPSIQVDAKAAKKNLRRIAHKVHPDFYATAGEAQLALAEENNALLNDAFEIVSDDVRRADWLIRYLGGPGEKDLGCMPQAFLMEVMEWNEILDDHEPGSPEFKALAEELRSERASLVGEIETLLTPLPASGADELRNVRKALNALRYIERALQRVSGLPAPI